MSASGGHPRREQPTPRPGNQVGVWLAEMPTCQVWFQGAHSLTHRAQVRGLRGHRGTQDATVWVQGGCLCRLHWGLPCLPPAPGAESLTSMHSGPPPWPMYLGLW